MTGLSYPLAVDWDQDGSYAGTGEDVADHVPYAEEVVASWGRDLKRDLSPMAAGKLTFALLNVDRRYAPENPSPPLSGAVRVGRSVRWQVDMYGTVTTLFEGPLDEVAPQAGRTQARVDFSALDGFRTKNNTNVSTPVYSTIRTGQAIAVVLDACAWPADKRDLDPGSTIISHWWAEDAAAPDAINALVDSEGPPAMFFVQGGVAVFRDRHHRLLDPRATTTQASYCVTGIAMGCPDPAASPCPTGSYGYTDPFEYEHGMGDITNVAAFAVPRRTPTPDLAQVWSDDTVYPIEDGETVFIQAVSSEDPFVDAVPPVQDTDFDLAVGVVTVALTRTSGQSTTILITAVGGPARVLNVKLRARPLTVTRTMKVSATDAGSVTEFGEQRWPGEIPWATDPYTAQALAEIIVGRGGQPRPTMSIRVAAGNDATLAEVVSRQISDRLTVRNDEHWFNGDVHVEYISHSVKRAGSNRPLHVTTFGVEKAADPPPSVPFIFDEVGHGFNDGYFDGTGVSNPVNMFIFDQVGHGFDDGKFAL